MQAWNRLDETRTDDGSVLSLWKRGEEYAVRVGAQPLMGNRAQGSEMALATEALERAKASALAERSEGDAQPLRVLVGGLGFGYTLRATLDHCPENAEITVAELSPALIGWNRTLLSECAGAPLEDARVSVYEGDIVKLLRRGSERWDVILLDVDNGPQPLTQSGNGWLYTQPGLLKIAGRLKEGGVLGVWSAGDDSAFTGQLRASGYDTEVLCARARPNGKGERHTLWMASPRRRKRGPPPESEGRRV